jgi:D-beta-D-heptose 7-phosphate kinase/D-beta-D-heptose 1-phosphate adenosyltransferase
VVDVAERRFVVGGAANVAANVRGMGATVTLAGVTGADAAGARLREELEKLEIGIEALVEDTARVTTVKTRVTAGGQQIVRFDEETRAPLSARIGTQLLRQCERAVAEADAIVISDYAKGVAPEAFCRWVIERAASRGIPVVIDPKCAQLSRYRRCVRRNDPYRRRPFAGGAVVARKDRAFSVAGHARRRWHDAL